MRAILAIIVVVLLLAFIGWISFSDDGNGPSATIETDKIESDLDNLGNQAERAGDEMQRGLDSDDQ